MSVGTDYRSKKAKGDVKSKTQKYDPYAYIPMSRMALNKRLVLSSLCVEKCINLMVSLQRIINVTMIFISSRKRAKMSGQFANLVKGATKGARKGRKQRTKSAATK